MGESIGECVCVCCGVVCVEEVQVCGCVGEGVSGYS